MNRALLGLVLSLTLLLLVQRLVLPVEGSTGPPTQTNAGQGAYDFQVFVTERGTALLRIETATGATWKRGVGADATWHRLNEEVILASASDDDWMTDSGRTAKVGRGRKRGLRPGRIGGENLQGLVKAIGTRQGIDVENLPEDLSVLTDLVRTGEPKDLRGWALKQISSYPPKDAVPALVGLLDHDEAKVLVNVIAALRIEEDPAGIEPLRRLVASNPTPKVAQAATDAIASLEAEAAKPSD
jgi:hypothetical protein